jgi:hypothetical protein
MKTNMRVRFPFVHKRNLGAALMLVILVAAFAHAQITPSADAYTNTADPTTNYGAATLLDVKSASETAYIRFNLASIPGGYTSADITQATLKLYVSTVPTAGSFNVDYVNGAWVESTITSSLAPALGTTIAASVPLVAADKNQFILIDVTSAVQAWLSGTSNDGIALVGNSPFDATFDSKESTSTSHAPELDIVFASGGGTITGVNTASGSGLTGGGTSGTLNLGLLTTCASGQVLEWNGTAWACATGKGTGTITGVTAGTDLTGGGTSGKVTLNLDTTKVPQLNAANTFTQAMAVTATVNTGSTITATNATQFYGQSAISGNATFTGTGSTIGVEGYSQSTAGWGVYGIGGAAGVYGGSTVNGVFGNSTVGNGVWGQTAGAGGSGVYGVNSVSGFGVIGYAAGSSGQGVWGESFGTGFSNGAGSDGVHGVSHTTSGSGVAGINTAQDAVGVYGSNTNGYGFLTDSHAAQGRSMGGWVKAMLFVNPFPGFGGILRCFNSQINGSQAATVPCGMTFTYIAAGHYRIDFGFQVDDRFLQVTSSYGFAEIGACLDTDVCPGGPTATQVDVYVTGGYNGDAPFHLAVF